MKKRIMIVMLLFIALLVVGCGNSNQKGVNKKTVNLNSTKEYIFGKMTFKIPDIYEKSKESSELVWFYQLPEDSETLYDLMACSFDISKITASSAYPIDKEIREEFLPEYYDTNFDIVKKKYNGNEWSYAKVLSKKDDKDHYYYKEVFAIDYSKERYMIELVNYSPETTSCDNLINGIVNSTKFSK